MSKSDQKALEENTNVPTHILTALEDLTYEVGILSEMVFMVALSGADLSGPDSGDLNDIEH